LVSKLAKSADLTFSKKFSDDFEMDVRNAELDADFESFEKVVKNSYEKNY